MPWGDTHDFAGCFVDLGRMKWWHVIPSSEGTLERLHREPRTTVELSESQTARLRDIEAEAKEEPCP